MGDVRPAVKQKFHLMMRFFFENFQYLVEVGGAQPSRYLLKVELKGLEFFVDLEPMEHADVLVQLQFRKRLIKL